ncbi:hypothetical protein RHMOL_Rhmol05G0027500 [Rhododendron molle]|uniref:Uncharacterized protein n=1 Tax=Rhododendron molle TaxID=49168 RepID=A0ACC0NLW4_RHOML|nr:hypothetical protein RHMOL_Rhmol05G0027500 [Rhododendron molle]
MADYPKFDISSLELKNRFYSQVLSISFRESELKVLMVKVREIIFLRRAQNRRSMKINGDISGIVMDFLFCHDRIKFFTYSAFAINSHASPILPIKI